MSINITNVSLNATQSSILRGSPILWNAFLATSCTSAIFLAVLSVLTAAANGLLLLVLYKDPLKRLRQPSTILINSLAFADFLTGVLVDPIFSYFYFQVFKDQLRREDYNWLLKLGGTVSSLTMNISFLTILLLSGTQFIAITYPHRHKVLITKKRVVICVVCIWVYSILYSASLLMGIPEDISIKLGVFLNLTFIHFLVLVSYIALYVSYRRQLSSGFEAFRVNFASPSGNTNATEKLRKSQRQPVVACLLLTTCLVIFVTPVTVMWYVTLYWKPKTHDQLVKSTIANVVVDAILFVKFLIDPFIYAWRLPRFRQAIRVILTGKRPSTMRTVLYS